MKRILKVSFLMILVLAITNLSGGLAKAQTSSSNEDKNLQSDLAEIYSSVKEDMFKLENESNLIIDQIFRDFVENNNAILLEGSGKKEGIKQLNKIKKDSYIQYNKVLTEKPSTADKIKYEYKQQIFAIISNYKYYNMNLSDVVEKAIIVLTKIESDSTGEEITHYINLNKKCIKDLVNESITLL